MYRSNNDQFNDGREPMPNPVPHYPAAHKMHAHSEVYSNPMPLYYEAPPAYEYPPVEYDPRYPAWRQMSDTAKPHHFMPPMAMPPHFDRSIHEYSQQKTAELPSTMQSNLQNMSMPGLGGPSGGLSMGGAGGMGTINNGTVNILQRISGLIKSQLPILQATMIIVETKRLQEKGRKQRSRSRSRSRDRVKKVGHEWLCPKCAFPNFQFRDRCKKCTESRPEAKGYVSSPEDWRCSKCNNINYARRSECNRCHLPRYK